MPFGDGTGPRGLGPMTGRGAGYCSGFGRPGFANPLPGRVGPGWGAPYWYPYVGRYGAGIPYAGYGNPHYGRRYTPFYGYPRQYPVAPPIWMWPR